MDGLSRQLFEAEISAGKAEEERKRMEAEGQVNDIMRTTSLANEAPEGV